MALAETRSVSFAGIPIMHKCERCTSPATVHITRKSSARGKFESTTCAEQCYPKYFRTAPENPSKALTAEPAEELEEALFGQHTCPDCGIQVRRFHNSHRLGCAAITTYSARMMPLLENIHGDTKHCGKTPRNYPKTKKAEAELTQLRQRLKRAVDREDYEEAAKLRDQIRTVEEV